uniref:Enkurin domain-containing protein n=1 Tax=Varanus komodoensis TaxID=61221 RepID=A0A8D2JEI2_VARKO
NWGTALRLPRGSLLPSCKRPPPFFRIREKTTAPCQTMGVPKLQVPTPRSFLRKHSREPKLPQRKDLGDKVVLKPHVPKRTEHPIMGLRCEKDFITANVAEAMMSVAKRPLRACVDVRTGDKFLVDDSGLVKKYLKKKDFGKTPSYIKKRKAEAREAQEAAAARLEQHRARKGLTRLSREERERVLQGLKQSWEQVNRAFQGLSVVVDTVPRRLRKEKMEAQMRQLERDVRALERHPAVYVAGE